MRLLLLFKKKKRSKEEEDEEKEENVFFLFVVIFTFCRFIIKTCPLNGARNRGVGFVLAFCA